MKPIPNGVGIIKQGWTHCYRVGGMQVTWIMVVRKKVKLGIYCHLK